MLEEVPTSLPLAVAPSMNAAGESGCRCDGRGHDAIERKPIHGGKRCATQAIEHLRLDEEEGYREKFLGWTRQRNHLGMYQVISAAQKVAFCEGCGTEGLARRPRRRSV